MVEMAIQSFLSSATGNNCQQVNWRVPDHPPGKRILNNKTDLDESSLGRREPVGAALDFQIAPTLSEEMICGFIDADLEAVELPADAEAMAPLQIADGDIGTSLLTTF